MQRGKWRSLGGLEGAEKEGLRDIQSEGMSMQTSPAATLAYSVPIDALVSGGCL